MKTMDALLWEPGTNSGWNVEEIEIVPPRASLCALYRSGQLMLDELVTNTYRLEDINQTFWDMHDGKNIRDVIVYDA